MEQYSQRHLPSFSLFTTVILFHVAFIFFLISYAPPLKKASPKKLTVRTITLQPVEPKIITIEPLIAMEPEVISSPKVIEESTQIEEIPPIEKVEPIEEKPIEAKPIEIEVKPEEVKNDPIEIPAPKPKVQTKPIEEKKTVKPEAKKRVLSKKPVTKKVQPKKQVPQKRKAEVKEDSQIKAAKNAVAAALEKLESSQSESAKKKASINNNRTSFGTTSENVNLMVDTEINSDDKDNLSVGERTYYDELVSRLKLALRLPEYGKVQLKITLSSQGSVLKVIIANSKSAKNKTYLEKSLPKISFPSFGENFNGSKEHTFSLSVLNEINY